MNHLFQNLVILTSPPASGKTFWISKLSETISYPILVISPLRALADECRENWNDEILVMTPEEWMIKKVFRPTVIFDEFHLFFYWGDTFRPRMWEAFFLLCQKTELVFLLTATLSSEMKKVLETYSCQFDQVLWLDHGNQRLKNLPDLYIKAFSKKWIEKLILNEKKTDSVRLIFCQYRDEVFEWEKRLLTLGFSVISCVGGEARDMRVKLKANSSPDFIVSTTVLSHGVNLPNIEKIYFLYPVRNIDFWIQMVARGGRRGEKYEVYALENPQGIKWNAFTNLLAILLISFKMKLQENLRPTWFLKD